MKFILFCCPRTGSTLICEALNAHPDIVCGREMFNSKIKTNSIFQTCFHNASDDLIVKSKSSLNTIKETLLDTINYNYDCYLDHIFQQMMGFKIIANQVHYDSKIWDTLFKMNVKFIFLERDLKESCTSFHTAVQTQIWHTKTPVTSPLIQITQQQMDDFYNYYFVEYKKIKNKITKDHDHLLINYSEISDWANLCDKLCIFLNVPSMILPKMLVKIRQNYIKTFL